MTWTVRVEYSGPDEHLLVARKGLRPKTVKLAAPFLEARELNDGLLLSHERGIALLDARGEVTWANDDLAMTGIELGPVVGDAILGRGDWGTPGWRGFAVSTVTGDKIEWTGP